MRNKKSIFLKGKPKYAIVIDGETEFWYLQMLKRNEKLIKVDIKPEIPQKKKLSEQYLKIIELSMSYDKVYWIIDLDVVLSESLKVKKGNAKTIDVCIEYKTTLESKYKNVVVIINQPCLEFWFLIHFEIKSKQFSNCDEAGRQLKKYLPEYSKTEKFFVKKNDDIYIKLKPYLKAAIENSKKANPFDITTPNKGLSEMYKLFEEIKVN